MRVWLALVLAAGCSRPSSGSSVEAGAPARVTDAQSVEALPAPASASTEGIAHDAPSSSAASPTPPAPSGEAKRTNVASVDRDPLLAPQLPAVRQHFGDFRGPFALQTVGRAGGGSALLVSRPDESDPLVLVVDRDRLLYAKERPVAGIVPPVRHVAIAPGPERGVAVFAWVESLHLVAGRMWADDSNAFAESVVMKTDACDALSVGYQAGLGWIVACASDGGTRAQRLRDNLTSAWGEEGVSVGTVGPVGRATIGFDGPGVWTLTQKTKGVRGDRTETFRYDGDAQPLSARKNPSP